MRANSLATRLFVSATAWVVAILLITGIALSSLYNRSVERAFDRRLNFYLRTLIARSGAADDPSDKGDKSDRSVQSLGEPLFEVCLCRAGIGAWLVWMATSLKCGHRALCGMRRCLSLRTWALSSINPALRLAYVNRAGKPASAHGGAAG